MHYCSTHFPYWSKVQRHQLVPNSRCLTQKICWTETYHLSALLCRIQITALHDPKLNRGEINNPKHCWRAEQTGGLSERSRILLFSAASAPPSFSRFQQCVTMNEGHFINGHERAKLRWQAEHRQSMPLPSSSILYLCDQSNAVLARIQAHNFNFGRKFEKHSS